MYENRDKSKLSRRLSEDPWDVPRRGMTYPRSQSVEAPGRSIRFFLVVVFSVFLSGFSRSYGQSSEQKITAEETTRSQNRSSALVRVTLKETTSHLVSDYLNLVEELKTLTEDYSGYFTNFQQDQAEQLEKELHRFSQQLSDSSYYSDYRNLSRDLKRLQSELVRQEEELSRLLSSQVAPGIGSGRRQNSKLYRITETLRRELDLLHEQFVNDISRKMEASEAASAIVRQYIKTRIAEISKDDERSISHSYAAEGTGKQDDQRSVVIEIDLSILDNLEAILDNIEVLDIPEIPEIPPAPELPPAVYDIPDNSFYVPESPAVPRPPAVCREETRTSYTTSSGQAGLTLRFVDSTRLDDVSTPVYVVNPLGSLEIEAWDHPWIHVESEVDLSAESPEKADEISSQLNIRVYQSSDAAFVEMVLPQLYDPRSLIRSNTVKIKAPIDNPLNCSGSNGELTITGFHNDVKVRADRCDLKIENVDGRVEATNRMGRIRVSDVLGRMGLKNSFARVDVSRCRGEISIVNEYGAVDIQESSGELLIQNSGRIDVLDFTGGVRVQNDRGTVHIRNLDGSLQLSNTFSPVFVDNIRGPAGLDILRGSISVDRMEGPLSVTGRFGEIKVESVSGPVYLVNSDGTIDFDIDRSITGQSTINADRSKIKLRLGKSADMLLTVETVGGAIHSSFPDPVNQSDSLSSTRVELGNMSAQLAVSGRDSKIVIDSK